VYLRAICEALEFCQGDVRLSGILDGITDEEEFELAANLTVIRSGGSVFLGDLAELVEGLQPGEYRGEETADAGSKRQREAWIGFDVR
jgi:hypothetical protein